MLLTLCCHFIFFDDKICLKCLEPCFWGDNAEEIAKPLSWPCVSVTEEESVKAKVFLVRMEQSLERIAQKVFMEHFAR